MNGWHQIFLVLFIVVSFVRYHYVHQIPQFKANQIRHHKLEKVMLGMVGVTMLLPVVYILVPFWSFAEDQRSIWIPFVGTCIYVFSIWVLAKSHIDLADHWHSSIAIKEGHSLVTSGIYKYIRHPMYAAHLGLALGQGLLIHNYLVGWAFLIFVIPFFVFRIPREEQMLSDTFPDIYPDYRRRTGMLWPKITNSTT